MQHLRLYLRYELRRISQYGLPTLLIKVLLKFISLGISLVLLPLSIVLHLLGFRCVTVFTDRIGHLAIEPDCLLKEHALDLISKRRWFILAPPGRVANSHLLGYWKPLIRVYENRFVCFILASMSRWGLMCHDTSHYILAHNKAQAAYRIYTQWGDRPPLLSLTQADEEWGVYALRQMGLPNGAWFVCVHVRESGFSPIDEELQAHRNASIDNVISAMHEITSRGGWIIRIGDPSMTPLPPLPQVIDYAHHSMKCDRLDIVLCAKALFILGNTSGIALVGSVFGVPCALANMIPFPALGLGYKDITIPKLLWSEKFSRYLTFREILDSSISSFIYASLYQENGIRVVENSAEDIRWLTLEMIENLENLDHNRFHSNKQNLQVAKKLGTHHYGYGGIADISSYFVQHNKELFKGLTDTQS